jgi:hypothetical protein
MIGHWVKLLGGDEWATSARSLLFLFFYISPMFLPANWQAERFYLQRYTDWQTSWTGQAQSVKPFNLRGHHANPFRLFTRCGRDGLADVRIRLHYGVCTSSTHPGSLPPRSSVTPVPHQETHSVFRPDKSLAGSRFTITHLLAAIRIPGYRVPLYSYEIPVLK